MVELSNPKYTYTKRGVFYFSKKVPTDLRHHYKKPIITQSLRTKSKIDKGDLPMGFNRCPATDCIF